MDSRLLPLVDVSKLDNSPHYLKYVRVEDEYRFCHIGIYNHSDLVQPEERAISAGTIRIRENSWNFEDYGSSTLGIKNVAEDDEENLTKLIGKEYGNY